MDSVSPRLGLPLVLILLSSHSLQLKGGAVLHSKVIVLEEEGATFLLAVPRNSHAANNISPERHVLFWKKPEYSQLLQNSVESPNLFFL